MEYNVECCVKSKKLLLGRLAIMRLNIIMVSHIIEILRWKNAK